jgi:type II secretory pathway component GspD/PulD (secretin)
VSLPRSGRFARIRSETGRSQASPAGLSLTADEATNTLIAAGESRTLDRLERLIRELDVREAQVLVEVLAVTLSQSQTLDLGMEIQRRTRDGETLLLFTSLFGLGSPSLPEGAGLPTPTATGFSGVVLDPGQFSIVLSAFSALNEGRFLSIPKMLVNNNQQATLNSVLQSPFSSTYVSNTVSTTSFGGTQDAGTTVTVRPQIAEGDHLVVDYAVSLSAFVGQAPDPNLPPPRQQNHLQSVATVPDGYTVALGGLEIEQDAEAVSKVPLLGDIPWLGALFQSLQVVPAVRIGPEPGLELAPGLA